MNGKKDHVEAIFQAAMELNSPREREVFLNRECEDSEIRREVKELLRAAAEAEEVFEYRSHQPALEQPGSRIGRYHLLQKIGEGGCGVVYLAEQEMPVRRKVALKIVKLGMDTRNVVARFEAERQALALMDHPNIAKVLDAGATGSGRPYFVMDLVHGHKITDYCDQEKLSIRQRLDLFIQVCQAVQHAHQKGIIHRDLKPSNVLVTERDGVPIPKVIDFGIAKATGDVRLTDKTVFTAFEHFIGTPAYMSPEQARLGELDIDTRSDIYSLGVLLYELLTGQSPFNAAQLRGLPIDEVLKTIREQDPPRPSTRLTILRHDERTAAASCRQVEAAVLPKLLRGDLDWIVMTCLQKDRTKRYETANALARDIHRHLNSEPVVARPPSRWYEFQKTVARHKIGFAATAAVITALAAGVFLSSIEAERARRAKRDEVVHRVDAEHARTRAELQESLARQRAYASDMALAQQALRLNNIARAAAIIERQIPPPGKEDLRGFEWRYLWKLCHGDESYTFSGYSNTVTAVAFSPNDRLLATTSFDKTTRIWDIDTHQLIKLLFTPNRSPGQLNSLAFAPDGGLLAGVDEQGIVLWRTGTWEVLRFLEAPTRPNHWDNRLAFSHNGRRLLFRAMSGVKVWDTANWELLTNECVPISGGLSSGLMAATADGRLLAMTVDPHNVELRAFQSHRTIQRLYVGLEPMALAFSPNGNLLAEGTSDGSARIWETESAQLLAEWKAHSSWLLGMAFSPNGDVLATSGADQLIQFWDVRQLLRRGVTNAPANLRTLKGHRDQVWGLAFSNDGKTLASCGEDGTAKLWDLPQSSSTAGFTQEVDQVWLCDDGSLVGQMPDKSLKIWSLLQEGTPVQKSAFTNFLEGVAVQAPAPDGRSLFQGTTKGDLRVIDVAAAKIIRTCPAHNGRVTLLNFSADGHCVFTSSVDETSKIWDAATLSEKDKFEQVERAALSANGRYLASTPGLHQDGSVRLRDVLLNRDLAILQGHKRELNDLMFSPAGDLLATSSADGTIRLWRVPSGKPAGVLRGHTTGVESIAFTPNGKTLASVANYDQVILWHVATLQEMLTFPEPDFLPSPLRFSADGVSMVLASGNVRQGPKMLRLWHAPSWSQIPAQSGL
jgi:WD40 repeat protein/serine/threonine protein kinase